MDALSIKNGTDKEIHRLYDAATQHYRLRAEKVDLFDALLTVILQQKLDEKTWLKWAEFKSDCDNAPLCTEFLKFLDLHARHLEIVSPTGHKQASGYDHKLPVKQSYASSTDDTCLVCTCKSEDTKYTCVVFSKDGCLLMGSSSSENKVSA